MANGLKFVPTPALTDKVQYKTDIRRFTDKLRKNEYFDTHITNTANNSNNTVDNSNNTYIKDLFSNPTRWMPPDSNDKVFLSILNSINAQASKPIRQRNTVSNINSEQNKALKSLTANKTIVIKSADKGGATVIINKVDYHRSMLNILNDEKTYCISNSSEATANKLKTAVMNFVKKNKKYFTPKEANYLYTFDPKLAYIYGLPKIHKCTKLKAILLSKMHAILGVMTYPFSELNIPFRPIVSGKFDAM